MKIRLGRITAKQPKPEKFNFEKMKAAATHPDAAIRKQTFIEYFKRFEEFPTYLFDNERAIDEKLRQTIDDIAQDPESSKEIHKAIDELMMRLPN
jgi:hypothetical protein